MLALPKVPTSKINLDLTNERKQCSFNILELTHFLDGGAEKTRIRKEQERFFLDDPELSSHIPVEYLSCKEKYEEDIRKLYIIMKKLRREKLGIQKYRDISGTLLDLSIFKDSSPLYAHFALFVPTIKSLATEDQMKKWLKPALNCNIIGSYAQTELAHGTFIKGLETTATYDLKTQEFVLNSPTLTSYKFWPTAVGKTSNYAIVVAQLYSLGQCHGVHFFLVQLRNDKTHQPLSGIKIGCIGPRWGLNGGDHGFLGFENVRIPRENMFMKNSKILMDGSYIQFGNNNLGYESMIRVRVALLLMSADVIKKSATIAVRYNCVRRQSQRRVREPECQIIDYVTQQYKLFPQIATFFAFNFTSQWLEKILDQVTFQIRNGNPEHFAELHALSACLKAVTTSDAAASVEICRLACGGHGYMMSSGFPRTYEFATAMITYDGENTVLLLQTGHYLMKVWLNILQGKAVTPAMEYLREVKQNSMPFRKSIDWVIWSMEVISTRKIELTWKYINDKLKGQHPENASHLASIKLVAAAEAFARTLITKTYTNMMSMTTRSISPPLKLVLTQLLELYGVHTLLNIQGDLLKFTDSNADTIDNIQSWLEELLKDIRANAVGLVDGFDLRDEILSSVLGEYDGNVYERLYEEAARSPLNDESVNKMFNLYLKPHMKSKY